MSKYASGLVRLTFPLLGVLLCISVAFAGRIKVDIKGKIKSVDIEKKTITVNGKESAGKSASKDKEVILRIDDKTEFADSEGGKLADGLKSPDLKEGAEVAVAGERSDKVKVVALKITLTVEKKPKDRD